jgi:uncharacterized protein (TIGR03067 family)
MPRVALGALLMLAMLAPQTRGESSNDAQALQGTWVEVSVMFNGAKVPDAKLVGNSTTFKGSSYVHVYGNEFAEEGAFTLNPGTSPKQIDFLIQKGPNPGKRQQGIYKLDGDNLTVCVSHPDDSNRPAAFVTTAGSNRGLVVFKRKR